MIQQGYEFEIISPCFCAGAHSVQTCPEEDAEVEIRAASIRGQLRWWFRLLGGFKSLKARFPDVRRQEAFVFGSTAGDDGSSGRLRLRVVEDGTADCQEIVNDAAMNATVRDIRGYLLFPLRKNSRAVSPPPGHEGPAPGFKLLVRWTGPHGYADDLRALFTVFGILGSLGFRSRRAMGAVRLIHQPMLASEALERFETRSSVAVFSHEIGDGANMSNHCINFLAEWLQSFRMHGQRSRKWDQYARPPGWKPVTPPPKGPGFAHARRDHNEGLDVQGTGAPSPDPQAAGNSGASYRPALGLPIVQMFSSLSDPRGGQLRGPQATVNWSFGQFGSRFASPVILRPHFDGLAWRALVMFVDAKRWPTGEIATLQGTRFDPRNRHEVRHTESRAVSPDLYDEMKRQCATGPDWKPFY